ncbi:hypothetical protein SH528x_002438 [Novipirellula sp. SH528]|uniref:hypothetical protein n=1 Tax=Novipirellula sp. SH528 TaxID=3454466 RepID=UPI003FA15BD8
MSSLNDGQGGIDFDFAADGFRLFADPDWWRLVIFMRRIIHDKFVDCLVHPDIIEDPDRNESIVIG